MLFYVPPLLPVMAAVENGVTTLGADLFARVDDPVPPVRYLARLFAAGNERCATR